MDLKEFSSKAQIALDQYQRAGQIPAAWLEPATDLGGQTTLDWINQQIDAMWLGTFDMANRDRWNSLVPDDFWI